MIKISTEKESWLKNLMLISHRPELTQLFHLCTLFCWLFVLFFYECFLKWYAQRRKNLAKRKEHWLLILWLFISNGSARNPESVEKSSGEPCILINSTHVFNELCAECCIQRSHFWTEGNFLCRLTGSVMRDWWVCCLLSHKNSLWQTYNSEHQEVSLYISKWNQIECLWIIYWHCQV